MEARDNIVGLLLAAGRSRRFGSDKLLQRLPDGRTLLEASLAPLAASVDRVLVLVRPGPSPLHELLQEKNIPYLEVPESEDGMGTTLAAGIRATAQARGWIVGLADMPCLLPDTANQVVGALRHGAPIAAPFHQGRRGHPVGFAARWHDALAALQGDQGARTLLQNHPELITRLEVDGPGCLIDIDTPEALASLSTLAPFPAS